MNSKLGKFFFVFNFRTKLENPSEPLVVNRKQRKNANCRAEYVAELLVEICRTKSFFSKKKSALQSGMESTPLKSAKFEEKHISKSVQCPWLVK